MASSDNAIEARGLLKLYGATRAVDAIDLTVRKGEIFGLLGPNGAGKTTTILMLLGLTETSGGSVDVLGFNPVRQPLEAKRRVGYLPDTVGFYDHMTARENLIYTARLLDMPRRVSTYAPSLQTLNDFVSASAFVLGSSMLVFVANLIYSLVFARIPAAENPWASRGLEWQVPTPVPLENFERIPVINSGPYEYGVEGAPPTATLGPAAVAAAGR